MRNFLPLAFLLLGSGVVLGAFGAHGLKDHFSGREEEIWKTAVFYQLIHSFGILIVIAFAKLQIIASKTAGYTAVLFSAGIFIFSGSLYLLVLTRERWLGAITPFGGALMIAAWLILSWDSWKRSRGPKV